MKQYYIYIMANDRPTLYIGVTNDLIRRVYQHKNKLLGGFTSQYSLNKLVYYEIAGSIESAITREKQIKNWRRSWKLDLIKSTNPCLNDLSDSILNQVQDDTYGVQDDKRGIAVTSTRK